MLPASQARHHKIVHLVELPVGVPRPEIVPPAARHGRQFRDDLLHFLPALPLAGQLSHAIAKFRLRRLDAPSSPMGEAKGRIVPIRFNAADLKRIESAARASQQTVSEWIGGTVAAAMEAR